MHQSSINSSFISYLINEEFDESLNLKCVDMTYLIDL